MYTIQPCTMCHVASCKANTSVIHDTLKVFTITHGPVASRSGRPESHRLSVIRQETFPGVGKYQRQRPSTHTFRGVGFSYILREPVVPVCCRSNQQSTHFLSLLRAFIQGGNSAPKLVSLLSPVPRQSCEADGLLTPLQVTCGTCSAVWN